MKFKNKKGDVNIIGMIVGVLVVGLFFGIINGMVESFSSEYETNDYDENIISNFSRVAALSEQIKEQAGEIDKVGSDPSWFDWFSGMFNKLTTPFKFTYRTFEEVASMGSTAVSKLNLLPIFDEFIITLITVLIVIGIVMFEIYLGRRK
jgi:hypothetical protein